MCVVASMHPVQSPAGLVRKLCSEMRGRATVRGVCKMERVVQQCRVQFIVLAVFVLR